VRKARLYRSLRSLSNVDSWATFFAKVVATGSPQKVYLRTIDQPAETRGESPHKMKSPQTPFRTTLCLVHAQKSDVLGVERRGLLCELPLHTLTVCPSIARTSALPSRQPTAEHEQQAQVNSNTTVPPGLGPVELSARA
jgi:hypothetical protein